MERVPGWWIGASTVVSPSTLWGLAMAAGGWQALEGCGERQLCALGLQPDRARAWVRTPDGWTRGRAIPRTSRWYPEALQGDERAPPVLYAEGAVELLGEPPGVAVVGTRRCSGRGAALARTLGRELARAGLVVVSGLARGIDACAHAGAILGQQARTIAVLGHGLGHMSPASNRRLRERIVQGGGLVLSGWPDPTRPERWTFPRRNRWIAGLARAVVVVEAGERSGALITARDAQELGREVWAVPGPPDHGTSAGTLALIDQQRLADRHALEVLRLRLAELLEGLEGDGGVAPMVRSAARQALREPGEGRVRPLCSVGQLLQALGRPRRESVPDWIERLLAGATVEELARDRGVSAVELQARLTRLEIDGALVRLPGGRYAQGDGRS